MSPATDRRLTPPVLRTARFLSRLHAVMALWFTGVIVALWLGAMQYGDLGQSMAQFARQGVTWFPFSITVTVFATYHTVHVAAGMTRRSLGVATLLVSLGTAVALSAFVVTLFFVEGVLYEANGWHQVITEAGWFPASPDDLLAVGGWHALLVAGAQASGLLVSVVYQRAGAWRGTLALPLTAGPIVGLMFLLADNFEEGWLTIGVRVALAVLVTLAMAVAYLALLRGSQLRPPRS